MEDLYKSGKFIIGFLVITLIIQTALGEKTSEKMTLFVLLSMLVLNADKFTQYLTDFTNSTKN